MAEAASAEHPPQGTTASTRCRFGLTPPSGSWRRNLVSGGSRASHHCGGGRPACPSVSDLLGSRVREVVERAGLREAFRVTATTPIVRRRPATQPGEVHRIALPEGARSAVVRRTPRGRKIEPAQQRTWHARWRRYPRPGRNQFRVSSKERGLGAWLSFRSEKVPGTAPIATPEAMESGIYSRRSGSRPCPPVPCGPQGIRCHPGE